MSSTYFVRNFEIESLGKTLEMQQKTVGDVSCVVWDASIVLSKYLEIVCGNSGGYLKGKKVIELGAGLGCAGLVSSCFGAHVIMTDLPDALINLSNNIEHNKAVWKECDGSAESKPLEWGSSDVYKFSPPDVIIAADCVYYDIAVEPLVKTIVELCGDQTEVVLCQEERGTEKQQQALKHFLDIFDKHFDYVKVPLNEQHSLYSSEEIFILRGRRKSNINGFKPEGESVVNIQTGVIK